MSFFMINALNNFRASLHAELLAAKALDALAHNKIQRFIKRTMWRTRTQDFEKAQIQSIPDWLDLPHGSATCIRKHAC